MAKSSHFSLKEMKAAVVVFLALSCGGCCQPAPSWTVNWPDPKPWWYPGASLYLDVGAARLDGFAGSLVALAASQARAFWFSHISVMAEQRAEGITWERPPSWTTVAAGDSRDGELNDDADASNLLLRMDNLNPAGFTNTLGHWFAFDDQAHLITDATPLGFTGSYCDLVGGYLNLQDLRLGRDAVREALRVLANYVAATGDKEQLKRALAVIIIMICEAARFPRLREKIAAGWLAGTYLTPEEVEYVDN